MKESFAFFDAIKIRVLVLYSVLVLVPYSTVQ